MISVKISEQMRVVRGMKEGGWVPGILNSTDRQVPGGIPWQMFK